MDLTRRQLIEGLGLAAASATLPRASAAQTAAPPMAPYPADVLPPGIRSRFVDNVNGLRMHVLEAGYEPTGRPARPAAARLPRARLQLAQGDGTDRRGRLSRDRAGRARLRPHLRHGRALRRRPGAVPHAQPGARHAGSGVGVRLSLGGRGDRTRSGIAARRLVRAGPTGRLPVGDDDERAVRRSAGAAVRHRGRARPGCAPRRPTRSTTSSRR